MVLDLASLLVIGLLPGAVMFRLPVAERDLRARLAAEERLFWQVILSLALSLSIVIALGAAGQYSFRRLVAADLAVAAVLASAARFRLRLRAPAPGPSALIVTALIVLGVWRFFPPAEYVMGGKDPGTYMNEGLLLAQRGTLVYHDPLVSGLPEGVRGLFFSTQEHAAHYGSRFMGFPVLDPAEGAVVGQFPHLFPASIAVAYGLDGLTGARRVVGVWAVLGLLAVYFAAARLVGRPAAAAAAALLAVHVIQVWFSRYPNAEVVMQTLLFAALLANARAHVDGDRFFAPVAGVLLTLLLFLRVDAVVAIGAVAAANLLAFVRGQRLHPWFVLVLAAGSLAALVYYQGPMRAYAYLPTQFVLNLTAWHRLMLGGAAALLVALLYVGRRRPQVGEAVTRALPLATAVVLCLLAIYALYFREPAGRLALENAYALRMYADFYVTVPAVIAALGGYVLLARRSFWRDPALLLTIAFFAAFFFYKIRIVPEHFWAARRFLPVILPGTLVLACAAALWGLRQGGPRRIVSGALGLVFLALLGSQYARAARPVLGHVEYAGIIPQLEQLATRIADTDLVVVESRDAGGDAHVLALPLAYIYARNVLVLGSARPDPVLFSQFLEWARTKYGHVYFFGGGGTELVSPFWSARLVTRTRFDVPEYESALNRYPRLVSTRKLDFGLYDLQPGRAEAAGAVEVDIGVADDLHVVRFHAKEETEGRTIRWSGGQSFVTLPAVQADARTVVLTMSAGGRPPAAPPAVVSVALDDHVLGSARVGDGFGPYEYPIPPGIAARAAASAAPVRLRLTVSVWNPHEVLGTGDDRELGVMVDRVQVR